MKSFYGLIPRYLMKNKKRNLFLGLSIMFSVLIMTSFNICFNEAMEDTVTRNENKSLIKYDLRAVIKEQDRNSLDEIGNSELIESETEVLYFGKTNFMDLKENIRYELKVEGYDDNVEEFFNIKLLEGRYPKDNKEIVFEKWVLPYFGENLSVGDTVKLKLYIGDENKEPVYFDEEYKLVGIVENNTEFKLNEFGAEAFVSKDFAEENNIQNQSTIIKYYKVKNGEDILTTYNKLIAHISESIKNSGYNSEKNSIMQKVKQLNTTKYIGSVIMTLVSSILIYNMFSATVALRMKELGMLEAIGADKKQISFLLLGEAILIGVIFISIGIFLGAGFNEVLSWYSFKDTYKFNGLNITLSIVLVSIIFSFLPMICGVLICNVKLNKRSVIETMNYKNSGNIKNAKDTSNIKNSKKFYNDMASKNIKRTKGKFINTVISLSITIIMFMMINYIVSCVNPMSKDKNIKKPTFIISESGNGIKEESINKIGKLNGVDNAYGVESIYSTIIKVPEDRITMEGKRLIEKRNLEMGIKNEGTENGYALSYEHCGYSDDMINQLKPFVLEGKIDLEELNKTNKIVLVQNLNNNDVSKYALGDKIVISPRKEVMEELKNSNVEKNQPKGRVEPVEYEIAAILDPQKYIVDEMATTRVIMSYNIFEENYGKGSICSVEVYLGDDEYHDEVLKEINNEFDKRNYRIIDKQKVEEGIKKASARISTLLYSFIAILVVISIFNIINIMYMNISSRKKEISMLRAIGMSKDEVKAMVVKETFYYCIYAAIISIPLGTLSTYVFFQLTKRVFISGMVWSLPIGTILSIFIVMALVCLFASLNACKSVLDESIVEGVKAVE
ncbi:MacB-like core domain-containing protein [Clostridium collagenovorans DSM 3089]|uniref:MacB-like core domain-containing protein n=1 Tax=Clostridium collagenovorans DSM 3089 TaxID=1121306 RepID=A0A1M5Y257_9CLOT|nr:ABC transporter permease [Clostridium collagenovorans]SHI06092.1 MacB-like core domain-containing protein [Clostridium collagenovorans DSM 3089]